MGTLVPNGGASPYAVCQLLPTVGALGGTSLTLAAHKVRPVPMGLDASQATMSMPFPARKTVSQCVLEGL